MVDDIVELPRPLKKFKMGEQASYTPYEAPTSEFGLQHGICVEIEDLPICIGNEFQLIAGKDAPFRYKLMEHTPDEIREYVTLSDGPILSKDSKMFILWMNSYDRKTRLTTRYYFWDRIAECREYYGFQECTHIAEEMKNLASMLNPEVFPGLQRTLKLSNAFQALHNERHAIDNFHMLRGNILAMQDALMGDYLFHPDDVLRGVDLSPRKEMTLHTGAGRILSRSIITPDELKHLMSPDHVVKPYHMCLRPTKPLLADTRVHALVEYSHWFDVLKYAELIPYSEFTINVSCDKEKAVIFVYGPYDDVDIKIHDDARESFDNLVNELYRILPKDYKHLRLDRSWGEEVYITLELADCTTKQYYFDLMYAALGSRMFTPKEQ